MGATHAVGRLRYASGRQASSVDVTRFSLIKIKIVDYKMAKYTQGLAITF